MILALALFLSPTFWHDLIAQTPVHVIAVAGAVAGIVQIIKRLAPNAITGRWILLVNTVLSIAGVFTLSGTANFWTETTWAQIILIIIGASGLHTTTKTLAGASDPSTPASPNPIADVALCLIAVFLSGCATPRASTPPTAPNLPAGATDSIDATANQTLQTIQAFMRPIVRDIANGKMQPTDTVRTAVNRLDGLYNTAVVAEQGYHACRLTPETTQAACLTTSGINGALTAAQTAFTSAQTAIAASVSP